MLIGERGEKEYSWSLESERNCVIVKNRLRFRGMPQLSVGFPKGSTSISWNIRQHLNWPFLHKITFHTSHFFTLNINTFLQSHQLSAGMDVSLPLVAGQNCFQRDGAGTFKWIFCKKDNHKLYKKPNQKLLQPTVSFASLRVCPLLCSGMSNWASLVF